MSDIAIPGIAEAISEIERRYAPPDFTRASEVMRLCGYESLSGGKAAIEQAKAREQAMRPDFCEHLNRDEQGYCLNCGLWVP